MCVCACLCLRLGSTQPPWACSLPRSVLCCRGNVQGTELCYQALVAWAGGSGNSASVLTWEMLNIYSWSSWAQHHRSSPRLWVAGGGYQASSLLISHQPLPFSTSEALLDPQLLLGLLVSAAGLAELRVLVVRGESAGGWEGRWRLNLSVGKPGPWLGWGTPQTSSLPQAEILEGSGCYTHSSSNGFGPSLLWRA